MAAAPTYAAYVAAGGRLPEARFSAALPGAAAAVDAAVWPNEVASGTLAAYQAAVCAVVDLVDSPPVTRENIGRASYEYADVPTVASTIRRHLTGTGLLYRGI